VLQTALLDADCLHKLYLRGILLWFADQGAFEPCWTIEILEETMQSLVRRFPLEEDRLRKQINAVSIGFPGAEVDGYQHLIGTLGCPDPKDEHVLAAALTRKASKLVTLNVRDFPNDTRSRYGIEIVHPDDFLVELSIENQHVFLAATARWIAGYSRPKVSVNDVAQAMIRAGCPRFAGLLKAESGILERFVITFMEAEN
jgi:predicted nucleic acid-binding protein